MQMWDRFLETLENDFGKETIDKWLRSLTVSKFDAGNLYLVAQDSFQFLWFEEHVRALAEKALKNPNDRPIKIKVSVQTPIDEKVVKELEPQQKLHFSLDSLDPNLTFEHFILYKENFLTFQIFSELVGFDLNTQTFNQDSSKVGSYNPIFVYGEEGSGKTHLLNATALAMQKQNINVLYVKAETFTEHMIKAMRIGQMAEFRKTYRDADMLIVDNIEQLANKSATQEEFFHTFNTYHTSGKQLVLASNLPPKKLEKIEPRLISRFEWGILLNLTPLPKEKLSLFMLKRINHLNLGINKEIKEYLLCTYHNPSQLAKALETLYYKLHLDNHTRKTSFLSVDDAKKILSSFHSSVKQELSPDGILSAVSESFEMNKETILGKSQTKEIVFPRQLTMYLLRNRLKMPYLKIGKLFSRDHSTVISSVKQITQGIKNKEAKVVLRLEELEKKLA